MAAELLSTWAQTLTEAVGVGATAWDVAALDRALAIAERVEQVASAGWLDADVAAGIDTTIAELGITHVVDSRAMRTARQHLTRLLLENRYIGRPIHTAVRQRCTKFFPAARLSVAELEIAEDEVALNAVSAMLGILDRGIAATSDQVSGHRHRAASDQATAILARKRLHAAAFPGITDDKLSGQNLDIALRKLIAAPGGLRLAVLAAAVAVPQLPWTSPDSTAGTDRLVPHIVERLLRHEGSRQSGGQGDGNSLWGLGDEVLNPLAAACGPFAQARAAAQLVRDCDSEELL